MENNENNDAVRFAELKALAERATPGKRAAGALTVRVPETEDHLALEVKIVGGNRDMNRANTKFIAACDPQTILALIAAYDAQAEALASQALRVEQLVGALIDARAELEAWSIEDSGEQYNNPAMNAIIDGSQPAQQPGDVRSVAPMSDAEAHKIIQSMTAHLQEWADANDLDDTDEEDFPQFSGECIRFLFAAIAAARPSAGQVIPEDWRPFWEFGTVTLGEFARAIEARIQSQRESAS